MMMKKIPMSRKITAILLLVLLLSGCREPGTSSADALKAHSEGSDKADQKLRFASTATQSEHVYKVHLPAGYATSDKQYPVIYMTDAQWNFDAYANTLAEKNMDVILVGIEQTSEFRRHIDFTAIGYEDYSVFLKEEFIPFIEKRYRTAGSRAYAGQSLGALFGAYLLSQEPIESCFFCTYFLFDGTFNLFSSSLVKAEERRFTAGHRLRSRVFLTGANPGNHKHVSEFEARYKSRDYVDLKIESKFYQIHHNQVAVPSFTTAVETYY